MKMIACLTDKPWGQIDVHHLQHQPDGGRRIGEVSFGHPAIADPSVLIKYLYTSERLSIQVHPDNDQAQRLGHACGKDEMWIVLEAARNSTIGLGLRREVDAVELRAAVLDGSIEELVDWRSVKVGDVIYNPAGTIHAAGADLVLLEVQQSVDLTYRLYDYGRPRQLHLTEGLAVAKGGPHFDPRDCSVADGKSRVLADGPYFGAAWCVGNLPQGVPLIAPHYQVVIVAGEALVAGVPVARGECVLVSRLSDLQFGSDTIGMVAWPVPKALAQAA